MINLGKQLPKMRPYYSLLIIWFIISCGSPQRHFEEWTEYLGDKGRSHYSTLEQIDHTNLHNLKVAWTYASGDASEKGRSQIQCSPIVVNGLLYGTNPVLKLFAVDAATGKQKWQFSPDDGVAPGLGVNRGVIYWDDQEDGRIVYTSGRYIYSVDALSGELEYSFGQDGKVDLRAGLGRDIDKQMAISNTPGVVHEDILIQGTRVNEGPGASPGHIRAYDLNTGEMLWIFHTIPEPGEFGHETWPENAWEYMGGANSWSGMTLDEETGIVYIPTGSASFDFYGGNRHGQNLFANSLLALNAKSGERLWHFQFVHHDLWDRDLPAAPNLVTIKRDGVETPAVTQVTKSGHVFVFDRKTGEPLYPIEEKPVPSSDLEGEEAWPTQPLPTAIPPFARQEFTRELISDLFPDSQANIADFVSDASHEKLSLSEQHEQLKSSGQYIPPSEQGNIMFPGFDGGAEWGGAGYDPETGILYVNSNEMPWMYRAKKIETIKDASLGEIGQVLYEQNCARCHGADRRGQGINPSLIDLDQRLNKSKVLSVLTNGQGTMPAMPQLSDAQKRAITSYVLSIENEDFPQALLEEIDPNALPYTLNSFGRFLDERGYPAVKPPWGTLNAIDLNKGEISWQVPLGELEELTALGIGKTGTENYGGPAVTKSGLVFIAATKDEKIRAFDKSTGEELWSANLPAGGYATPITYQIDGKQYLVIACGGGKMGTASGDQYVAFSLENLPD